MLHRMDGRPTKTYPLSTSQVTPTWGGITSVSPSLLTKPLSLLSIMWWGEKLYWDSNSLKNVKLRLACTCPNCVSGGNRNKRIKEHLCHYPHCNLALQITTASSYPASHHILSSSCHTEWMADLRSCTRRVLLKWHQPGEGSLQFHPPYWWVCCLLHGRGKTVLKQ